MNVFESLESEVRSYSRSWPVVFDRATGSWLYGEDGTPYLDFFAGAGALNYGHNNPVLKQALIDYIQRDGVTHALDMQTVAKRDFLETFQDVVLAPREPRLQDQFPGPAGANAVEAALKLARKVTGRESIINFTNAFHGMTLGALSVTGNSMKRGGAGIPLVHATPMPYDNYLDGKVEDFLWFERLLDDSGSRPQRARRRDRRDRAGRGRHQRRARRVAARPRRPVPAPRHPADRRRRADGLRAHRPVLLLRVRGHHPGHRLPVEVDRRLRAADGAHADPAPSSTSGSRASTTAPSAASTRPSSRRPRRCARTGPTTSSRRARSRRASRSAA